MIAVFDILDRMHKAMTNQACQLYYITHIQYQSSYMDDQRIFWTKIDE